jgi:hypothetical protein
VLTSSLRLRRCIVAATGVAVAAGFSVTATALPSYAAAGDPVISAVGLVGGDPGLLTADVASDTTVTSVKATLVSRNAQPPVTQVVELTETAPDSGIWRSARVSLSSYDDYDYTVAAVNAAGDSTSPTATDPYWAQPKDNGTVFSPSTLDFAHQTVTVSGTLEEYDPKDGTTSPWPGQTVQLDPGGISTATTTSGAGSFSTTYTPSTASAGAHVPVVAEFVGEGALGNGTYGFAQSTVTTNRSPTRITLDPFASSAKPGAPITITGVAEYEDTSNAWHPIPSAAVDIDDPAVSGTADSTGAFSISATAPASGTSVTASLDTGTTPGGAFLAAATKTQRFGLIPTTIHWSNHSVDEFSGIQVDAQVGPSPIATGTRVDVETSANGKTGWKNLGWVKTNSSSEVEFYGYAPNPRYYYRLRYGGSTSRAAAVSNVVRGNRYGTRVTKLNASPEPVHKGHKITVTGTAQKQSSTGKWSALSKKTIQYFFRAHGAKTYHYVGSSKSSSSGHFSKKFTAKKDGSWSVVWFTTTTSYINDYSPEDYVNVK